VAEGGETMLLKQILTVPEHSLVPEHIYTGLLFLWPLSPVQVNCKLVIWGALHTQTQTRTHTHTHTKKSTLCMLI